MNNIKTIYSEERYLVVNEEIFVCIYSGMLRYIDDKGDRYDIVEDISVEDIRQMITNRKITFANIRKTFFKKEEMFYLPEKYGDTKIKSKNIKNAYIYYLYKKENVAFTFDELKKRLSTEELVEYCRDLWINLINMEE